MIGKWIHKRFASNGSIFCMLRPKNEHANMDLFHPNLLWLHCPCLAGMCDTFPSVQSHLATFVLMLLHFSIYQTVSMKLIRHQHWHVSNQSCTWNWSYWNGYIIASVGRGFRHVIQWLDIMMNDKAAHSRLITSVYFLFSGIVGIVKRWMEIVWKKK